MTLDITHLKPGDKVRLRNGEIAEIAYSDGLQSAPVNIHHPRWGVVWYRKDGTFLDGCNFRSDSIRDIIEILPTPALSREEVIDILKDGAIFHNSDVEPDLIDSILAHLEPQP
jgi:hypothetical protein